MVKPPSQLNANDIDHPGFLGDISRAADAVVAALENDPLFQYALDLPVS